MTSTNDGKDVKSNQTSGHKSKSYYIELYTSLEKALSSDNSLEERTRHVCEAWRRVYSLYQHSATSTHPHLLSWLQRHTANTVLQSKWAKSKNEHTRLADAIDALVAEATAASAGRPQHPWEQTLLQRAAWFKKALENPWDNPVLKSLINPNSEPVTDQQVLEWLISEHGIVLVTRLQRMVGAGNCDDLALLLASAVMDRARAAGRRLEDDGSDQKEKLISEYGIVLVTRLQRRWAPANATTWRCYSPPPLAAAEQNGGEAEVTFKPTRFCDVGSRGIMLKIEECLSKGLFLYGFDGEISYFEKTFLKCNTFEGCLLQQSVFFSVEEEDGSSFVAVLEREASFTSEEWAMLTDIELVLLLKTDKRPRCIELAKLTPLRQGYKMVERLRKRLEMSPRDKKLWKHAKEVAIIVTQVIIARCMVVSSCSGAGRDALYWCARSLARLVEPARLRSVSTELARLAATARHLHTFCAALSAECKELKADVLMKPFICELYVRAITAGMNELEQLKLKPETESEARLYEETLAGWFTQLGGRLTDSVRLRAECALTAFSVHPARKLYERVASTVPPPRLPQAQEPTPETTSEYGSWANDSRTQSNLVKTSETLQLKQSQQHQANVLSTAILTEGEALGLETELCQDLAVLLSGPRVKTLSWDMDREVLLENCRSYMEKTHGGTRAVTTELKYLNLDPTAYQHLPEEDDDENDVYYGIEKGYEHEVQFEEPEEIWQNAFFDPEQTESAEDSEVDRGFGKKKSKASIVDSEDEDPLSTVADAKKEKKKRAKEKDKEQKKKKTHKRDDNEDGSTERRKDKDKKTKKERKKDKSEQPAAGSLNSLLGMKVAKVSSPVQDGEKRVRKKKERRRESTFSYVSVTDSDQISDDPSVLVDGVFSMDELKSPERLNADVQIPDNTKTTIKSEIQCPVINEIKTRPMSSPTVTTTSSDSDVTRARSPYLTPNQLAHRHVVNPKVKSSLHKLLQFRRNQNKLRAVARPAPAHTLTQTNLARPPSAHTPTQINLARPPSAHTPTQTNLARTPSAHPPTQTNLARPSPAHTPTQTNLARPSPAHTPTQTNLARPPPAHTPTQGSSLVGMKIYNPDEVPKVYLNKKQCKQLETLSNDVNNLMKSNADYMPRTPCKESKDKLQGQQNVYNTQKLPQQYNNPLHMSQNVLSESQKLSEYTTNSPVKVAQQPILNQSSNSTQTNYTSPAKTAEHVRLQDLNVTPPKPTIVYHPLHRSMQNLSTDKQELPKKPLLINDPNYFSQQHVKASNASQLSPKIISNTVIKPPSQAATAKDDFTKLQAHSNLHRTYMSKPAQNVNSQMTSLKSDLMRSQTLYERQKLNNSMQNITEVPRFSHDATKRHIPTPQDMPHGRASNAKPYNVTSHNDALNSTQPMHSNSTQTCQSGSMQNRERVDVKTPLISETNDFDDLLKELFKSIHAGSDKNVTVALNKDVKLTIQAPSTSAKRTDLVTPQCAKQQLQQKKPENVPTTFSRLSYMHKNKQNEIKVPLTDSINVELNKKIIEHKISKSKCMKNEITLSRVGITNPDTQDPQKMIRRIDQSGSALKRGCPLLSSMLESTASPNVQPHSNTPTTSHNAADNLPNREDADLLLLLRNPTLMKPNANIYKDNVPIGSSTSDGSHQTLNPQTKVETQVSNHQTLVGTKVKNINILDTCSTTKESSSDDEWKRVMDAIRARKTEPLGPNALELALKKDQGRHSQGSSRTSGKRASELGQSSLQNRSSDTKKREHHSSKTSSSTRTPSTEKHSEVPKKPRQAEVIRKVSPEMLKRLEVQNKHSSSNITRETPHTSVIPNSDFDMLDDLIDDDLRRELGEISSDEDAYTVQNATLVKGKSHKNIPKPNSIVSKAANMPKEKTHFVNPKTIIRKNQPNSNTADNQDGSGVNAFSTTNYPNVIVNNCSHSGAQPTKNSTPETKPKMVQQYAPATTIITDQVAQNTANNILTHIEANHYVNNILPTNVIIASVPQQPVVVIRQDLVYDPYPTIRIHESQVNAELCAINQNVYAVNAAPNLALYQTTQFAAPVINPIIIGNATTTTNASNPTAMGNEHVTQDFVKEDSNMPVEDSISLETALRLSDALNETPVPPNLDFNMNRNCERKVLSQVHENHTNDVDKESHIGRFSNDDVSLKAEQDKERIKLKRQSLINRKICHLGGLPPIALTYTPLRKKLLQQESPKNGTVKPNPRLVPSTENGIVAATAGVKAPATEANNENIVSTVQASSAKENKQSCRRIWLRSSNKITNKKVAPVKRPRMPLNRKKIKLKVKDNTITHENTTITNVKNENKDGIKFTTRTSNRLLNKNKPSSPLETQQNVTDNNELIDFEEELNSSIVLKSSAAMVETHKLENTLMQELESNDSITEQDKQSEDIKTTEVTSQSTNKLEPTVVIEKLKNQLGDQLVIKSTPVKTCVKETTVLAKNQNLTILENKDNTEDCVIPKTCTSNKIDVIATPKTSGSEATGPPLFVDEANKLKPTVVEDQKVIKQISAVDSSILLDETNKLKSVVVDDLNVVKQKIAVNLPLNDQEVVKHSEPIENVSTSVQRRETDSIEVRKDELTNNKPQIFTVVPSTEMPTDTTTVFQSNSTIISPNTVTTPTNAESEINIENDPKKIVQLPPVECPKVNIHPVSMVEDDIAEIKETSTTEAHSKTKDVLLNTKIQNVTRLMTLSKGQQETIGTSKSLLCKENINEDVNCKSANPKCSIEKVDDRKSKINAKPVTQHNDLKDIERPEVQATPNALINASCKNVTDAKNSQKPGTYMKGDLKIVEVSLNDPNKKLVRIFLPNGKVFKAMISGKVHGAIDSLFDHPTMRAMLAGNVHNDGKRYTVNYKQVPVKNDPTKKCYQIQDLDIKEAVAASKPVDTVNLISDDEDEVQARTFNTEFGKYATNHDQETIAIHQKKFDQRCQVQMLKGDLFKSNRTKPKSKSLPLENNSLLTRHQSKVLSNASSMTSIITKEESGPTADKLTQAQITPIPPPIVSNTTDVIEIDDSSNDSIENQILDSDDNKNIEHAKVAALANLLLQDLAVETDKVNVPSPVKSGAAVVNLKSALLQDLGIVPAETPVIDITENDDEEVVISTDVQQQNKNCDETKTVAVATEENKIIRNEEQYNLKKCVVKIVKCETLIKKYELLKKMKHCYVKMERLNNSIFQTESVCRMSEKTSDIETDEMNQDNAEDFIEFDVDEPCRSPQLSRYPSLSILNNWDDDSQPSLENPACTSPVMEIYDTLVHLRNKLKTEMVRKSTVLLPSTCDSDWTMTKFGYSTQEILSASSNVPVTENRNLFPVCDNSRSAERLIVTSETPKLITITLKFLEDNPNLLCRWEFARRRELTLKVKSSPNKLKRKAEDVVCDSDIVASKVLKLRTLALKSLNSSLKTPSIPFEVYPKYKTTTIENIEDVCLIVQTDKTSKTDMNAHSEDKHGETNLQDTKIIFRFHNDPNDIEKLEGKTQVPGSPMDNTETESSEPAQSDIILGDDNKSHLIKVENSVACYIDTDAKDILLEYRELSSPSLLSDYVETFDAENEIKKKVFNEEVVNVNTPQSKVIIADNQELSCPPPVSDSTRSDNEDKQISTDATTEQSANDTPTHSRDDNSATCLEKLGDDNDKPSSSPPFIHTIENKRISLSISNEETQPNDIYPLNEINSSEDKDIIEDQEVTSSSLTDNKGFDKGSDISININDAEAVNDVSQSKEVEYFAGLSSETDGLDSDITKDNQQITSPLSRNDNAEAVREKPMDINLMDVIENSQEVTSPSLSDNNELEKENEMSINISDEDAVNVVSQSKAVEYSAALSSETDCLDSDIAEDNQQITSTLPPKDNAQAVRGKHMDVLENSQQMASPSLTDNNEFEKENEMSINILDEEAVNDVSQSNAVEYSAALSSETDCFDSNIAEDYQQITSPLPPKDNAEADRGKRMDINSRDVIENSQQMASPSFTDNNELEKENEMSINISDEEAVNDVSQSKAVEFSAASSSVTDGLESDITEDNQQISSPLPPKDNAEADRKKQMYINLMDVIENSQEVTSPSLTDNNEFEKENEMSINISDEVAVNDVSQSKAVEYSAALSSETDGLDSDITEDNQRITSPLSRNDNAEAVREKPMDINLMDVIENSQEVTSPSLSDNNELEKENEMSINISDEDAVNVVSQSKAVEYSAALSSETDCLDSDIAEDNQQITSQPEKEKEMDINLSNEEAVTNMLQLKDAECYSFDSDITKDHQEVMSLPPPSDKIETNDEDNQMSIINSNGPPKGVENDLAGSLRETDYSNKDNIEDIHVVSAPSPFSDNKETVHTDERISTDLSEIDTTDKDASEDTKTVNSPLTDHIETKENQMNKNDSNQDPITDTLHTEETDNSDGFDEISIDQLPPDVCEVVVIATDVTDIDIVETLMNTSKDITQMVKEDASEVNHDSEIKSPNFIDSNKIAFNYHDYIKQPKKKQDITTPNLISSHITDCTKDTVSVNDFNINSLSLKEQFRKDTPSCDIITNKNCPLQSKPQCKYELIQEDDFLTVNITTENDEDSNKTKAVFVSPNVEEDTVAVASPCSNNADDINLKGFEFEDVYIFPLSQAGSNNSNVSNDSQELNSESGTDYAPNDLHDIDFHVKEPEITYSRKRKISMRDVKISEKKYRKSKNIDCSKQTQFSMIELAYSKEYKRLLDYCSSVKFSYSRPFHKECIEIEDLMGKWPINSDCYDVAPDDIVDERLFVDLEDYDSYQPDPATQTFVEEISYKYNKSDAAQEDPKMETTKTNFNMGFGEGSGRVIQILKKQSESNISAATLSDVKQSQPVSKSVDPDDCNDVTTNNDDQIKKIRQHVNFIELRDKVRQFFKKSSIELKYDWVQQNTKDELYPEDFIFGLCSLDYVKPVPTDVIVQVVQVGQLPVSAAAQNPVTCDPRVTQVSDASPSQCSVDNSPNDDSQSEIKTEYTELTTADLSLPLQEYAQQNQASLASQDSNVDLTEQTISLEMEIKAEESPEIKQELPDIKEEKSNSSDTELHTLNNATPESMDYSFENKTAKSDAKSINYDFSEHNSSETFSQQRQQNGTSEKTDQIAHAMSAAGITTTPETVTNTRAHALVNILSQKIRQGSLNTTQTTTNTYSKTSINAMALQQALAQILPPPLNQTGSSETSQSQSTPVGPQVLHIVQGKNSSGNQITLVDNSQQSVISTPNATQVLHIVQNKNATSGQASNGTLTPQANSFSGLSLVDAGLQQGGNQLLHIVNTGNQKTASTGQLLKRVNLLTNLTNVQGSNEQKMVQFVCKSADGKAIQLNAPHQRSMVLRLQPIETPNAQTTPAKPTESQELNSSPTGSTANKESPSQQEIKSRSIYEENYAKFIQNSSSKTPGLEKSTSLPKFNQAFGKPVFQEGSQKQGETATNNSHLPPVNNNSENAECPANDNAINLEHMGTISSPPLLIRKPVVTSQSQSNIVQQIKQTIAPMNIQTMHGGVIYTRQIPVNIGGGQTINLITVPSTELINDDSSKTQSQNNQGEIEPSIIKIVPQSRTATNNESSQEENNSHASGSNENAQNPQPQPVLTQMRIKLPMLSKAPQMVPGARVVRPSFFQIQRNVISGANQPVYQQLVLTAAPPLGQQTIRLPSQASRPVKVPSENQSSSPESQMSSSTLEQLREFDMVLEQVKERSTSTPSANANNSSFKIHTSSDTTDGNASSNCSTESTSQVLYTIGNNQSLNVAYVNRKTTVTTPTTSTYVRSPDSSGIADSPTSSTHGQIPHTVTTDSSPTEMSSQSKSKVGSKSKSRPKSTSNPPNTLKLSSSVPPKTSSQKPLEDEQTTQRILYILAEYKEQVENSPDKDKPAPRRRSNPPSNPGSSKRKKSSSSRRSGTRDMSPVHGEDTCRTMGSEDSSCGTSQGDCTESCLDSHSPQDSPRKVARKITFDQDLTVTQPRPQPQRNVIVADGQTITVARGTTGKPATAVLMPANYILPVSMVKGGQQIAIVTNRGPKLLTVGGEGGATNALLLQRLIGPAGLKPVLARPGVRHVRLPTAALHNLQAFNLATATTVQPPDSTASPTPGPTPPELVDTRATSSPWTDRDEVKPERSSSPEGSEPWNLPSTDAHDYTYEETVRTDNMDRTVLDQIPDRYSPDMEAQRIFDKMFDVDSKKSYAVDSPRCTYDIDPSDCDDKAYQVVQKKDGSQRQHRLAHVSAAALRHKYAILEHELRLQKSLSEECEDLGVDSPSASELFPEAELLFANSPAHEHNQEHHSHTPQPLQSSIPQPDMDDQIATDHLIPREIDVGLGLGDVGIVAVGEDGSATIALDQEEFARSHPNTTFHSEPTEGEVQPFTIAGIKGRHITSTIFHSNSAPATVLMTAPQATVISQAPEHSVKYEIENMISSMPSSHNNDINLSSVLVKDDGLTRFDSILTDSRELHLTNTASAIVHSSGNATQVIRRVCYEDDKRERDARYLIDEPDNLIAGDDAKMIAEDSSRDATLESMADVDDDGSSPERHAELFWESNSASERSEGRRPLDFSSDSDKCCKSPSFDETNSTDSSGVGAHLRLDSVIKEARGRGRSCSGSADGSSAEDAPPLRTYPAKRSVSGKTRAGEAGEAGAGTRRRVARRGCPCCHGEPAPPRAKRPRQRKPALDFGADH
ncbi:LOW QUALITY PROTEIN: uncharacterized protein LOC133530791 [Cydia pomonella]|uniref:LOW QUALITY PROTEIN: uncharacterized protein LOC133530791 n=1 Tax=Cydia pomonella TaxID=82600 RepID=UPI002ADD4721|nr:LOW QUALITY PROTEIN: uncharacterized protein LOC133530791 [Cydia pomonella]